MVVACAAQVVECATTWGVPAIAADLYASVATLPANDVYVCEIVDSLDQPDALGYHSTNLAGRPYLMILAQGLATSITLSHEFLETLVDMECDQWRARGDGTQVALEVCDPVEGQSYPQVATVLGEGRTVELSNYATPAYFVAGSAAGTCDRLETASLGPFGMTAGGYQVIMDKSGNETQVFAEYGGTAGAWAAAKRLATRNSRLTRRLRAA